MGYKVDIGIIGALEDEVSALISMLENQSSEYVGSVKFNLGEIAGKKIAIARCGVGKVFAALCAEAMIVAYSPSLIVNTGVGGALDKSLVPCNVVIADSLVQHDMDTSPLGDPVGLISGINKVYFETDSRAVDILKAEAERMKIGHIVGRVATGDRFVSTSSERERIVRQFSASACEMEGGAIAQTAYVNSIPFAVVRAISDSADGNAQMSYTEFLPKAADISFALTLALIEKY